MAPRRIHWLAPTTVLLTLAAGVLFAVGHHLFYWSLEGTPVPDNDYSIFGTNVSRQQVNIGAGTAFAFLVNFALASALATAYAQAFWRIMSRTGTTLESLDTLYSAIGDMSQLLKVHVWWRYPLLLGLAIIAWHVQPHAFPT